MWRGALTQLVHSEMSCQDFLQGLFFFFLFFKIKNNTVVFLDLLVHSMSSPAGIRSCAPSLFYCLFIYSSFYCMLWILYMMFMNKIGCVQRKENSKIIHFIAVAVNLWYFCLRLSDRQTLVSCRPEFILGFASHAVCCQTCGIHLGWAGVSPPPSPDQLPD